jgi:hypothetical protein
MDALTASQPMTRQLSVASDDTMRAVLEDLAVGYSWSARSRYVSVSGIRCVIVGVRSGLAGGDLRPLYLAWLSAYGAWERDEDVRR